MLRLLRPAESAARRLVIALARAFPAIADDAPVETDPPWPLKESEVKSIAGDGLRLTSPEHFPIDGEPNLGRWRAVFER